MLTPPAIDVSELLAYVRFGEREAWDVGIRMTVQALGTNDASVGGAQFFLVG